MLGMIVGPVLFLFLLAFSPWSSLPATEEVVSDVPDEGDDTNSDASNTVDGLTTASDGEVETEQESSSLPDVHTAEIASTDSSVGSLGSTQSPQVEGSSSVDDQAAEDNNVTVSRSSGGGSHRDRSSDSSNSDSDSEGEDSGTGSGLDDTNSGSAQNDESGGSVGEQGDESFFVLPESPIGSIAMMTSALAALAVFLYLRTSSKGL
jgi:hypothetical protein